MCACNKHICKWKGTATVVHDVCPAMLTNSKTRVPLNTREPYTQVHSPATTEYCLAIDVSGPGVVETRSSSNLTCTCVPMHSH